MWPRARNTRAVPGDVFMARGVPAAPPEPGSPSAGLAPAFLGGGIAVLVVATGVAIMGAQGLEIDRDQSTRLLLTLGTVSTVAAAIVFALASIRWLVAREQGVLWAGVAALTYGLAAVAVPDVVGPIWEQAPASVLPSVSAGGQVAALVLFAGGAAATFTAFRLRMGWILLAAGVLTTGLSALFHAAPDLAAGLAVDRFGSDDAPAPAVVVAVLAAWLALGALYTVWGIRHRWLYGWCGLLMFSLTMAHLAEALSDGPTDPWLAGSGALAATGMAVAATMSAIEFTRVWGRQRARLFDSEVALRTTAVRQQAQAVTDRARRHDVANALLTIEGAAAVLEHHAADLDDDVGLRKALNAGIERLRTVFVSPPEDGTTVDLAEAAGSVVSEIGWEDRVSVAVPAGVVGAGSPTQTREVIRLLLANAEHRSPLGRIGVRGGLEERWAVLRVDDTGPLLSRDERRALTDGAGGRGPGGAVGELEMGVVVAGRLMRDQGGDLWIEPRPEGGCSFAVCLPATPSPVAAGTGEE